MAEDADRTKSLWFALLLTLANGFLDAHTYLARGGGSRRAFGVYGSLTLAFTSGALIGAIASRAWGVHAIWLPAGFLAVTLCLFIIYERHMR